MGNDICPKASGFGLPGHLWTMNRQCALCGQFMDPGEMRREAELAVERARDCHMKSTGSKSTGLSS